MKSTRLLLGLVLLAGLIGCSRSLVRSDYDQEVNFATLRTFDWKSDSEYSGSNNSLLEKRLRKAVEEELLARNLSKQAQSPDFLIAFSVAVAEKYDVDSYRLGYPYYGYGYWPGYYWFGFRSRYYGLGYNYGFYDSRVDVYRYKEARLTLDFVDPVSGELLWRGVYIDEIDESGIITEEKVSEAVRHMLEKFPPEK